LDLVDCLKQLGARATQQLPHLKTEEATKNALVLPFLQALGYDVFDPTEVTPEYTADVGTKKGEKVDYAILRDSRPIILIECKIATADLDRQHASQLYRYFSVTEARFGILTNGIEYRVYSDLDQPNKMDERPFLEFKITSADEALAHDLKRFSKESFDLEDILSTAADLKYRKELRRQFERELAEPSEDLVRLLVGRVYTGNITQQVREQFQAIVLRAFQEAVNERVNTRLQLALGGQPETGGCDGAGGGTAGDAARIVTTPDEIDAFYTVKALLRGTLDVKRLHLRDHQTYCSVLLDNSNRRPVCRLRFDGKAKQLGLFGADKSETRVVIESVDGILDHADAIRETVARHLGTVPSKRTEVAAGP